MSSNLIEALERARKLMAHMGGNVEFIDEALAASQSVSGRIVPLGDLEALDNHPLIGWALCDKGSVVRKLSQDEIRFVEAALKLRVVPDLHRQSTPVQAQSSAQCPICGVDHPHAHTGEQIVAWLKAQAGRFMPNTPMTIEIGTLTQVVERHQKEQRAEADAELSRYAVNEAYTQGCDGEHPSAHYKEPT